jgi:SAM-dependent methyltransferase
MRILLALLLVAFVAPAPAMAIPEEDLDVPYVPTPMRVVDRMLEMAEVGPRDYLIDLGSGDGRIAIAAAQRGARALGVDIDPMRIDEASAAARFADVETRALFRRQDLFRTPLREASVVTMYLLPDINLQLRPRILTELRPGTRVLSHNFTMGDWRPDAEEEMDASHIYMWIVPAVVGGRWALTTADGTAMVLEIEQLFQDARGTLTANGRSSELRDVALRGRSLRFQADTGGGPTTFRGIVGDATIEADPGAPPDATGGWIARRID